ncbi:hypothetical protein AX16_010430 [Volvariella volvacea WC 439]|nr:hypothetical protein AX16_010430 [Volvariella volvacea WC 439]
MEDAQVSPMSQLLSSLGITREDLNKRSDQMRQFLTSDATTLSRVSDHVTFLKPLSSGDSKPSFKSTPTSVHIPTRSFSRGRSNSSHDKATTPPVSFGSPVKTEPHDGVIPPPRQYASMEIVIERQRQNRKEKRKKERVASGQHAPRSPTPSSSKPSSQIGVSLDLFMESRDDKRLDTESAESSDDALPLIEPRPPVTPKKNNYYREHTNLGSATVRKVYIPQLYTSSSSLFFKRPTVAREDSPTPRARQQTHNYYPNYIYNSQPLSNIPGGHSSLPTTPQRQRSEAPARRHISSPLLPSSSPPPSSPVSSPGRHIVNLVSSPGPMGPAPMEEDYGDLPYTLPPGPYSPSKPDQSYAALVGQAILSSPDHRLTLQEIYDWITIVYPYFKRGETTWMNSIRHVLSTTVCFRKVTRDRSLGRTQWAIWDEDLECFKGGGFRKHLCKDYIDSLAKDKQGGPKGKPKGRKRADEDDGPVETRKIKRTKREPMAAQSTAMTPAHSVPAPLSSHPLFPPTRPSVHHQSYYDSCLSHQQVPQPIPADLIFPPLPAAAAINQIAHSPPTRHAPTISASTPTNPLNPGTEAKSTSSSPSGPPPQSDSSSSLPDLTPSHSSSSPPVSVSSSGDSTPGADGDGPITRSNTEQSHVSADKPTSYPKPGSLLTYHSPNDPDNKKLDKGKAKTMPVIVMPPSPTLGRRASTKVPEKSSANTPSVDYGITPSVLMTTTITSSTSVILIPSTPPARKSSLPTDVVHQNGTQSQQTAQAPLQGISSGVPKTPSNLGFTVAGDSDSPPFRTPLGPIGDSPFRTPGSRMIYDPHDPRMLLDEELSRLGAGQGESPGGLFGKGVGKLLYDSPGQFMNSPDKWAKWW